LDDINRRVANIVDAIAKGRSGTALLDKLEILESEKAELEAIQSHPASPQFCRDRTRWTKF